MFKKNEVLNRKDFIQALIIISVIWLVYMLLMPVNRTENDDGYHYAYLLLHGNSEHLYQSRFPLFLPFEKLIYTGLTALHLLTDAYQSMIWVSSVFAAAALFIFYLIVRNRFMLSHKSSVLSMLFLAFSYGFWRYAVEAELYSISHFLIFLSLYIFTRKSGLSATNKLILAGSIGGIAVLVYKPNFIPLFLAIPIYLLLIKEWKQFLIYQLTGAVVILAGYGLIFLSVRVSQANYFAYVLSGGDGNSGNPLMSVLVFFSDIASANYLYGFESIRNLIHERFPANMIVEEIMTASFYPVLNIVASITTLIIGGLLAYLLYQRLYVSSTAGNTVPANAGSSATNIRPILWLWFLVYWVILSVLDPNSPEPWMMLVPPLFFLIGIELISRFERVANNPANRAVYILLMLLVIHNLAGAIIPNLNKHSDYNQNQGHEIIANARNNDLIICFGSYTEFYYLQYYSNARVINGNDDIADFKQAIVEALSKHSVIFLSNDVIRPDNVIKFRKEHNFSVIKQVLASYKISGHGQPGTFNNPGYYTLGI